MTMNSGKLYYQDCHLRQFEAQVLTCEKTDKGYAVTLDQTAFYPEGGGQACDRGILGDVRVLDVQEVGQSVVHLCDGPLNPGDAVEGSIDWERRFDQMQQHTGEHIVSGIVHRLYGFNNTGFHVGADVITVDFDGYIPPEALPRIEAEANRVVWQNLTLRCWYPSEEELPTVGYRTKRALPWPVRIVEIPGVDKCACCGVQVGMTGEVGLVKLFSCVKFHQGVRIEMACGGRAMTLLNAAYDQNRQVSQAFSAKLFETGAAARTMNQRLADAEYRANTLQKQIFDAVAQSYRGKGNVLLFRPDCAPADLRELADRIADVCGGIAFVCSGSNICVVSRSDDLKELGKELKTRFQARGGGKPGYFQGSLTATKEELEAFFPVS
jgi:alanyl-tRNA synthetase